MKYVYLSAKVQDRIDRLKRNGKAGHQLARKVTGIIESLTSGAVNRHRYAVAGYTKYGENRIKNCHKYDLGCGYRLIVLRRDSKIYIPFLGPHDDCQRWLENNSRKKALKFGRGTRFRVTPTGQSPPELSSVSLATGPEANEEDPVSKLSDQDLRHVFRGLIHGQET
jgi:hypothetical protein